MSVADAFADGGALDRLMEVREYGSFPRRTALTFHLLDCVIHAWDLARAIDVPYEPPPDLVEQAFALARGIPDTDTARGPGAAFERSVKVPGDAADFDQLLGLLGRNPDWVSRWTASPSARSWSGTAAAIFASTPVNGRTSSAGRALRARYRVTSSASPS